LTGELKKVPSLEARLREADRMGIRTAFVSSDYSRDTKLDNLKVVRLRTLKDVLGKVF
jgi:DNA repair protein RadA/Sms